MEATYEHCISYLTAGTATTHAYTTREIEEDKGRTLSNE